MENIVWRTNVRPNLEAIVQSLKALQEFDKAEWWVRIHECVELCLETPQWPILLLLETEPLVNKLITRGFQRPRGGTLSLTCRACPNGYYDAAMEIACQLAQIYAEAGAYEQAIKYAQQARSMADSLGRLSGSETHRKLIENHAGILQAAGSFGDAIIAYRDALYLPRPASELTPAQRTVYAANIHIKWAQCYAGRSNSDENGGDPDTQLLLAEIKCAAAEEIMRNGSVQDADITAGIDKVRRIVQLFREKLIPEQPKHSQ